MHVGFDLEFLLKSQNTTKLLEGCVEGLQQCEELTTLLITSLEELWEPVGAEQNQVRRNFVSSEFKNQ